MSSKDDSIGLRSPRFAPPSPSNNNTSKSKSNNRRHSPVPPLQLYSRHVDADAPRDCDNDDRAVFQRYVAETLAPSRSSTVSGSPTHSPVTTPRVAVLSPRLPLHQVDASTAEVTSRLLASLTSASSPRSHPRTGKRPLEAQLLLAPSSSPIKPRHSILRPHSPVGNLPPETVISRQQLATPRRQHLHHRTVLAPSDSDKITRWLESLRYESHAFESFSVYCEALFRECRVLTQGKATPNRLQTAIAFHCLCRASSVFHCPEHILVTICRDLGTALFVNYDECVTGGQEVDALACYAQLLTYYDSQRQLEQQRDLVHDDIRKQREHYEQRLREQQTNAGNLKDREQRQQLQQLDQLVSGPAHRRTTGMTTATGATTSATAATTTAALHDTLQHVLQHFQAIDERDKQLVIRNVIDALHAHVTAETLSHIAAHMSRYERDKLLHQLFQDEIHQITENIRSEVLAGMQMQQNAILERSVVRITHFQTRIAALVQRRPLVSPATDAVDVDADVDAANDVHATAISNDDDLSDQDRKVLDTVSDVIEELAAERSRSAALAVKLDEAEQLVTSLRWKCNTHATEAQATAVQHFAQLQQLTTELAAKTVACDDKAMQTDQEHNGDGGDNDRAKDEDSASRGNSRGSNRSRASRRQRRISSVHGDNEDSDDDDLLPKHRRINKLGIGIASLIDQAKIPAAKIRKILAKRKPLTLNELHAIIVGYYQAKLFQDIQDDAAGKLRANLAQFIMEMYVLHYGLKDLAISQLVFLDASIRKHARESARVRTFGLLTGSLEPESHACSVQGIDFYLFVLVVIFNAGVYKRGRKQAVAIAQNLKTLMGDGLFLSPNATRIKSDTVCQAVDLVFSFTGSSTQLTDESSEQQPLEQLKNALRRSDNTTTNGFVDVDTVLEHVMTYWFTIYEQQLQDIYAMFALVDTNGDGTLDFREFCELVVVLEPDIGRRDALALYNKAAGDDNVIDKDKFVHVMLAHQRGAILKEFYQSSNSSRKIVMGIQQQRKQTFNSVSTTAASDSSSMDMTGEEPVAYQSLAGAMAAMDREESFASLAAAMGDLAAAARSSIEGDEDDSDDDGDDSRPSDGVMAESVSFMTLSRLSMWASEAKGKLQGSNAGSTAIHAQRSAAGNKKPESGGALASVLEQNAGLDFESDVDALLREALSKANICVDSDSMFSTT